MPPSTFISTCGRTSRQRSLRCHSSQLVLAEAVRIAVHAFFHFRFRDCQARALWCESGRVWLGHETFLHWALFDAQVDIPWVVATSPDAPNDDDALREAVRAELATCWAHELASLPRTDDPRWLPLP